MAESRRYFDDQRREVAVEKGLGGLEWGVFRRRKNTRTGISHLAHAAWGCLTLLAYEQRGMSDFDDRRQS